jgi:hypothetical protein
MRLKGVVTAFSVTILAAAMYSPSFAQSYDSGYGHGGYDRPAAYNDSPAQRWNRFLDQNQDFARRFRGNPNIIRDQRVMDDQPGVREFFAKNPDVREYVYRSTRNDGDRDDSPRAKWNRLLAHNPDFAERYRQNPGIIDDPNVMRDEPEVREFLRTNPDVRASLYGNNHHDARPYGDREQHADAGMNAYLADHPNLAHQLRDDPSLLHNRDFLDSHPNLRQYLRNHPEARY